MAPRIQDCTPERLNDVRALFEEYAAALGIDLCFQDFGTELDHLPGKYAPPAGRLLVATDDTRLAGCVALRPIDDHACELKRLYVRPAYRGTGLGRKLAETVIAAARNIGYAKIRLHTLPVMKEAFQLYQSLGFVEDSSNQCDPVDGVKYMELELGG